jgi:two-component system cell cycle sensor histidine kinase/response regulator CckA
VKWTDEESLRARAEKALAEAGLEPAGGETRSALLYELSVHQAELEMQNEALRDAHLDLAASEARYRELFENAPTGYLVVSRAGEIELCNRAAAEILGSSAGRIVGSILPSYFLPEEALGFERYRREVLGSSTRLTAEFKIPSAGGRHREVRLDSIRTSAEAERWRIALSDVTAYNEMARRNNHVDRLEAVGRRASSVAHDLNNLLVSMLGYADIALQSLDPKDAAFDPMLRLREMGHRCAVATGQLATFSRAEPAESPIIDLNVIIGRLEQGIRAALGTGVELVLALSASDAVVRLFPAQVEQVVLNAVQNATQAMPGGGSFRIETSSIELDDASRNPTVYSRYVRWIMTDTGTGMTESTRQSAFEPFFTTKPSATGAGGLGLSLIRAVVRRAGGTVTIESELGRGTRIIIDLPRASGFFAVPATAP